MLRKVSLSVCCLLRCSRLPRHTLAVPPLVCAFYPYRVRLSRRPRHSSWCSQRWPRHILTVQQPAGCYPYLAAWQPIEFTLYSRAESQVCVLVRWEGERALFDGMNEWRRCHKKEKPLIGFSFSFCVQCCVANSPCAFRLLAVAGSAGAVCFLVKQICIVGQYLCAFLSFSLRQR
ncbi:hypothetical protein R84865_000651 [Carnimonas sp. R-84865]